MPSASEHLNKYNTGNEEGETALDDIFQSLVNVEENVHGEMNGDEQTLSTAKSGKSNKSMKSQRSQQSEKSSHSNLNLTEKLDKISKNEGKQVDDDENLMRKCLEKYTGLVIEIIQMFTTKKGQK
jgi:hypothetical protein